MLRGDNVVRLTDVVYVAGARPSLIPRITVRFIGRRRVRIAEVCLYDGAAGFLKALYALGSGCSKADGAGMPRLTLRRHHLVAEAWRMFTNFEPGRRTSGSDLENVCDKSERQRK